jgi:hypothetical protein
VLARISIYEDLSAFKKCFPPSLGPLRISFGKNANWLANGPIK